MKRIIALFFSLVYVVSPILAFASVQLPNNHVPAFVGPTTANGTVGTEVNFALSVNDEDGDDLTFSNSLPDGSVFNAGYFQWTPTQSGTFTAHFTANDGQETGTHDVTIVIASLPENHLPVFVGPTYASTTVGNTMQFSIGVNDQDSDPLRLSQELPQGATFAGGNFSWTPTQAGDFTAKFFAHDGHGTSTHEVALKVFPVLQQHQNHLPVFTGPTTATTTVGTAVNFAISVNDEDGDVLTLTQDLPTGATFATGTFNWVPSTAGTFIAKFTAFDGTGTSTHETSIVVSERTISELPSCSTNGLYGSYYNLPANHPDVERQITGVIQGTTPMTRDWYSNQYLSFERNDSIAALNHAQNFFPIPVRLPGDPFYFAIHWRGSVIAPHAGSYTVNIGSDDDSWIYINGIEKTNLGGIHALTSTSTLLDLAQGSSIIDIYFAERHVTQSGIQFAIDGVTFSPCVPQAPHENHAPYFVNFHPGVLATSTEAYSYDVEAADPDNDPLSFSLVSAPQGMTIATSTGIINWTPTDAQATTTPFGVTIKVSDGQLFAATTYEIVVSQKHQGHINHLPVFTGPTTATTTVGTAVNFAISVNDEDGDVLTLTQDLPTGATFATGTFNWVPSTAGTFIAKFTAFDGTGTSTHETSIVVSEQGIINPPPPPPPPPPNPQTTGIVITGGGGGNGPPTPITWHSGGGGGVTPPPQTEQPIIPVTSVPSQPTSNNGTPPVRPATNPGTQAPSISIISTTTVATSSEPAESRSLAAFLLAGLFNFFDWLKAHRCILGWLLWLLTLIAFLLYIFFNRKREEEYTHDAVAPLAPAHTSVSDDIMLKSETPESTINEYWETYRQERE